MTIELTPQQQAVLAETREAATPAEFQLLLDAAKPQFVGIVREVQGPNQPITTTLTELRDLYLTVTQHKAPLATVNYGPEQVAFFRDSIRLLDTAHTWFSEGTRTGVYRVRTVKEVVEASRPWRTRMNAIADQVFVFEPEIAVIFADVNTSGKLDEEIADLRTLTQNVSLHKQRLVICGLTDELELEGKMLLQEAENRDLLGVLGLRNKDEAMLLRDTILTYAVQRARQARVSGINGCFNIADAKRRFEAASFRDALRRLKPSRRTSSQAEPTEAPQASQAPQEPPADAPDEQPAGTPTGENKPA